MTITTDASGQALLKTSIVFPSAPEGSRLSDTPWPYVMIGGHSPSAMTGQGYCVAYAAAPSRRTARVWRPTVC